MSVVTVSFDARLPQARWGPLFHVLRLEHPEAELSWRPVGFPIMGRPLLQGADIGLFLEPPRVDGLCGLTLDSSPMVVVVAVGHRLAQHDALDVVDILDEPFPGGPSLHPGWTAFWTLDERRGGPPKRTDDDVRSADEVLEVVASGRAIAIVPEWMARGLPHPGVIALSLRDAPRATTRLVWRSDERNPVVLSLAELAAAWTR